MTIISLYGSIRRFGGCVRIAVVTFSLLLATEAAIDMTANAVHRVQQVRHHDRAERAERLFLRA